MYSAGHETNESVSMPGYQPRGPVFSGSQNSPEISLSAELGPKDASRIANWQMINSSVGGIFDGVFSFFESYWSKEIASEQLGVMRKYYDTERAIHADKTEVANKQIEASITGLEIQKDMYEINAKTTVGLAKIDSQKERAITRIKEEYKTKRAESFHVNQAFVNLRSMRSNGLPHAR